MSSVQNLPILGNVSLPVRLMGYRHKEDPKKFFQSGFAFFRVADDQADVTDQDGNEIGTLGSCMGGHYQVNARRENDSIDIIIDVRDIWNLVNELFDSKDVRIKFEGIEETYKEYWAKRKAEQAKKEEKKRKLEEIQKMQREAEEERELEELIKKEELEKAEKEAKKLKIIDDKGWDINKEIPDLDWELEKENITIPVNYGCGIKIEHDNQLWVMKHHKETPEVTLEITSWRGISLGAVHYYGKLIFDTPSMTDISKDGHSRSCLDIPMFKNNSIELTQVIDQNDIDRHPDNYKYNRVGDHHHGFYTEDAVRRRAKEVFNKVFGEDWNFKVSDLTR